ncbi:hypothetical protein IscW_ISCW012023 [Ixodes scapularis]|uniref:Uncharacterized protein n=1 Tax=Ixodes scapularis TaxID=6945 RepID=B7QEY8_IXOSC|nr:hypothetical protein IscW_ISCW012023 [Ixodes scapularis]|eukprot:XP_002414102.1 hypothetical protein IscW_ISCW012023 [Ixodes scapularis]
MLNSLHCNQHGMEPHQIQGTIEYQDEMEEVLSLRSSGAEEKRLPAGCRSYCAKCELSTKLHLHVCLQRQSDCDFDVALPTREIITVLSIFILLCGTALLM